MPTPPGDVSTALGIFITAVNNIFNHVNEQFRVKYPAYETHIDALLECLDNLCVDTADHVSEQLITMCHYMGAVTLTCEYASELEGKVCPDAQLHVMIKEFIDMIGEEPKKIFEESFNTGKVPLHSMN
jgi:hypothetical protein